MTGQNGERREPQKPQYRRSLEEAEKLFLANMKLVPYVANQMAINVTDDTLQDGYIGLWQAAQHFDETRGVKFPTFAVPVIRNSILLAWRNFTRTVTGDLSLDQPLIPDDGGHTEVRYADALEDPNGENGIEEVILDMYLTERLTEQERAVALMRMNGKPKTAIARAFGRSDYWVNDRIKSIQRKLIKDYDLKG